VTAFVTDTTPYPWPYHGRLDATRTALVVTGAGDAWAAHVPRSDAAAAALERLRTELPRAGVLVVVVVADPPWQRLAPVGDPAVAVQPRAGELVVSAPGLDGFYGSALASVLRRHGRTDLLVAGLGLETTVHGTVRRGNDRGDECLTVVDASTPHDPSLLQSSRSSIEMSGGIFGAVGETAAVLAAFAP
jgi:nicotinamidase-related amidase